MSGRDPRRNYNRYGPVLRPNSHNSEPINPHHNDQASQVRSGVTVYHLKRSVSQYAVSNELIKSTGYYTGTSDREYLSRPTEQYVPYDSRMPSRTYIPTTIASSLRAIEASPTTNPSAAALSSERSSNSLQTSNSGELTNNTYATRKIPMARRSKCNLDRYVPYILGKPEYIKNALLRLIQETRHIPDLDVNQVLINRYLQSVFAKRMSSPITTEEIMNIVQEETSEGKNAST